MFVLLAVGPVGAFAATTTSTSPSNGMVSLTFDDGTSSVLNNAIPILNAAHLPSTQYVITSYLDGHDKNFMNAANVRHLQAEGHEIGSHTRSHPFLPGLTTAEVMNELRQSKQDLAAIGINATTFAYPFGGYTVDISKLVQKSGYAGARTCDYGWNGNRLNRYLLKVHTVFPDTTLDSIKLKIAATMQDHTWLILVFHDVRHKPSTSEGTTIAVLQGVVDYLVKNKVHVVTVAEGLKLRNQLSLEQHHPGI